MILVIGNPENRRVAMFSAAADAMGLSTRVHSYESWLGGDVPYSLPGEVVRIESPGENDVVRRSLIMLGDEHARPSNMFGRVEYLDAWYRGFSQLLGGLQPGRFLTPPAEILTMFDKGAAHARLESAGVSVAPLIDVGSFDELMSTHQTGRFFVKPRFGSSASGVIALAISAGRAIARTSLERCGEAFFNQLKINVYRDLDEVRAVVDFVFGQNAIVERWIPKATLAGKPFDFRVVCIGGRATHTVARSSTGPITNLHLGNARGDLQEIERAYPDALPAVWRAAERAAATFPDALYCGVDVGLTSHGKTVVFEVNAFGDLLPNVFYRGDDTYRHQLRVLKQQQGAT